MSLNQIEIDAQQWDSVQAAYAEPPVVDYPQDFGPDGYPPPALALQGYPAYSPYGQRPTNGLAIASLVCSIFATPLGVIFGHVALSQINRSREGGRGLAIAGLVIGYMVTAFVVVMVLAVSYFGLVIAPTLEPSRDSASYSWPSLAETPVGIPDSSSRAIFAADVGDCIRRQNEGGGENGVQPVTVEAANCGTRFATHRVVTRTDHPDNCMGEWVRTTSYSSPVVLCLIPD